MKAQAVVAAFEEQSRACASLGSPFMGSLCALLGERLSENTAIGAHCLNWQGNPATAFDNVPLRLAGGLHALVLTGEAPNLAETYPGEDGKAPAWPLIEEVLETHGAFLIDWMKSPPQTNEVSRAAIVWPALMSVSARVQRPIRLLELGASAGLNLNMDRYSYRLGTAECGAKGSALHLAPEWRGADPVIAGVEIADRSGCDLNPLDLASTRDRLRLRSYVWPDQFARHERLGAALDIAAAHPPEVARADAIDWVESQLQQDGQGLCTVIYSTVAWQYFPDDLKLRGTRMIEQAGQSASPEAPLAWLRFEADGNTPGGNINLKLWPHGVDRSLGRADFHGRWVDWCGL